jgi:hypothetical protein
LGEHGFKRYPFDLDLYVKREDDDVVILLPYVDDIINTGREARTSAKVKSDYV